MKQNALAEFTRKAGYVPLAWAGSTLAMDYLNIGDALSPIMVALLSGTDVRRMPTKCQALRMGCVGTIGHGFAGGEVYFWGTGSSLWSNPSAPVGERKLFAIQPGSKFVVSATRGPVSERILTGGPEGSVGVYGDPVWLLPRFYRPVVEKKWKIGVIVHLSELADRDPEAHLKPELVRYQIPEPLRDQVRIINTVSAIDVGGIREKIDEILACERIVSTSLHGMVFAESYGIPCLHFPTGGVVTGLGERDLLEQPGSLDLRVVDLYRGLKQERLSVYTQPHGQPTDWLDLMHAIDRAWKPQHLDEQALIDAFPVDANPLTAVPGQTIWDHPVVTGLVLQHDVAELNRMGKQAG
jgi:hypothetical protein